jgi:hypothetical protein
MQEVMIVSILLGVVRVANMPLSNSIGISPLLRPPLGIPLIRSPDPGTAVLAALRPMDGQRADVHAHFPLLLDHSCLNSRRLTLDASSFSVTPFLYGFHIVQSILALTRLQGTRVTSDQ